MKSHIWKFAFGALFFVSFGFLPTANADLIDFGAADPATGFPTSFTDINLVTLGPCSTIANPVGGINGPPCGALTLVNFANGFVLDNIVEVTFYRAESVSANNSRLRIEVLGGCTNRTVPPCGPATIGNAALVRLQPEDMTISGDYTVTTPIGQFIISVADPTARVDVSVGPNVLATAPAFGAALPGAVQFFVPNGTRFTDATGSFLGDSLTASDLLPGFGWPTQQTGTVGPGGLVFRVVTPNAVTTVNTTLFTVEGQVLTFPLTLSKAGNGTGTVTSTSVPANVFEINCGPFCPTAPVQFGAAAVVTLTATPEATSVFSGWTGCNPVIGNSNQCTVTMDAIRSVTATFNEALNITVAPTGFVLGTINIGSTVLRTVTVTNAGATRNLAITQVTLTPATDFTILADNCSNQTLAPAGNCLINLQFLQSALGASNATLAIPSDDPQTPTVNVALSATGSVVPVFTDVPAGAFAEDFINTLFYGGITGGCGGQNYCPNSSITRKEMAVFIETSLGVLTAPACLGNIFTDVNVGSVGAAFCGYIEKLASDGITGGCGGSNFCPDAFVSRQQMAVFIESALHNLSNACTDHFTDSTAALIGAVPCGYIEKLASDGITGGCGPTTFCPNNPVTRAEMAVFLVTAPPPLIP